MGPARPRPSDEAWFLAGLLGATKTHDLLFSGAGAVRARARPPGAPHLAVQRDRIARAHYVRGEFESAAKEFRTALGVYPNSAKLAYDLARTLERLDRVEEATELYERYLELAPDADDHATVAALVKSPREQASSSRARVVVTSSPAGAAVYVDGRADRAGETPPTLELGHGDHRCRRWGRRAIARRR